MNYLQVIIYRLMDSICSDGAQKELLRKAHSWVWYSTWNHNGCKEGRREGIKEKKEQRLKKKKKKRQSHQLFMWCYLALTKTILNFKTLKRFNLLYCSILWPWTMNPQAHSVMLLWIFHKLHSHRGVHSHTLLREITGWAGVCIFSI